MAGSGNGFKFVEAAPDPLLEAAARAVGVFRRAAAWRKLVGNAMASDFSWERSAPPTSISTRRSPRPEPGLAEELGRGLRRDGIDVETRPPLETRDLGQDRG